MFFFFLFSDCNIGRSHELDEPMRLRTSRVHPNGVLQSKYSKNVSRYFLRDMTNVFMVCYRVLNDLSCPSINDDKQNVCAQPIIEVCSGIPDTLI